MVKETNCLYVRWHHTHKRIFFVGRTVAPYGLAQYFRWAYGGTHALEQWSVSPSPDADEHDNGCSWGHICVYFGRSESPDRSASLPGPIHVPQSSSAIFCRPNPLSLRCRVVCNFGRQGGPCPDFPVAVVIVFGLKMANCVRLFYVYYYLDYKLHSKPFYCNPERGDWDGLFMFTSADVTIHMSQKRL